MQPLYNNCSTKIEARKLNIQFFKDKTGLLSLPSDKGYWCLCNEQYSQNSEINQLCDMGFLKKNQFHGVDRDEEIIKQNKIAHPEANWYHGDWKNVLLSNSFKPGLIYLDSTSLVDKKIAKDLLVFTMSQDISPNTILCANFMLENPYSGDKACPKTFVEDLGQYIPDIEKKWELNVDNYTYRSSKTKMITYFFVRI